jgi:hypothetical protein
LWLRTAVFTWVYLHTGGSVLIATLLHGAINLSQGFFLGGIDPTREYWLLVAVYGVAALILVAATRPNLSRKPRAPTAVPLGSGLRAKETSCRP